MSDYIDDFETRPRFQVLPGLTGLDDAEILSCGDEEWPGDITCYVVSISTSVEPSRRDMSDRLARVKQWTAGGRAVTPRSTETAGSTLRKFLGF